MAKKKHPNGYWTEERCLELAIKCKTKSDFKNASRAAYNVSRKRGWFKNYTWFIDTSVIRKRPYKWTYEKCLAESKKYKTKVDFHDFSNSAYTASVKNGWINDFNLESTRIKTYGKTYSNEELNNLSMQCYNKSDFKEKYGNAYRYAKKNGLLDGLKYKGPIFKAIWENGRLKRVVSAEFSDKSVPKVRNIKYTYDTLYKIAKKYKTLNSFAINEQSAHQTAIQRGWIKDYVWLERKHRPFDEEECYNVAKTCKNKSELRKKDARVYRFAIKYHLLETYVWFEDVKSSTEQEIEDLLVENNIAYVREKQFAWLKYKKKQRLDFYLPEYNIAIECQGIQHFQKVKYFSQNRRTPVKILDKNKMDLCEKHGIKILYFSNLGINYPYKVYESKKELLSVIKEFAKQKI